MDIYETVHEALSNNDIQSVQHLLDRTLYNKIIELQNQLKSQNKHLRVQKNPNFPDDENSINFHDGVVFRGVNIDRSKNEYA